MRRPIPKRTVTWGTGSPPSNARTAWSRCSQVGRVGCGVVSMGASSSCLAHDAMLISHNGCYVDNPCSTPYPPRETVAYGKGERYGGALYHSSTAGVPAAQSVALFESTEPRTY